MSDIRQKIRRTRRWLRRQIQYLLASGPIFILRSLSLEQGVAVGGFLGKLAFRLLPYERKKTLKNINLSLGKHYSEQEQYTIGQGCFQNLGKSFVEVLHLQNIHKGKVLAKLHCHTEKNLQKAWLENKGVLIVTGHIGNWEYLATYMSQKGYPLTVLARDNPVPAFDRILARIRLTAGYRPLLRGTIYSAKESLKALRRGELLGLLIDQDTKVDGIFVDFFGRPAWTPVGAASLYLKTKAPIIMAYPIRQRDDSHELHFSEPLSFSLTGDKKQDQVVVTAALTRQIEDIISRYPDHWVWMHRRWKTKPDHHQSHPH